MVAASSAVHTVIVQEQTYARHGDTLSRAYLSVTKVNEGTGKIIIKIVLDEGCEKGESMPFFFATQNGGKSPAIYKALSQPFQNSNMKNSTGYTFRQEETRHIFVVRFSRTSQSSLIHGLSITIKNYRMVDEAEMSFTFEDVYYPFFEDLFKAIDSDNRADYGPNTRNAVGRLIEERNGRKQ